MTKALVAFHDLDGRSPTPLTVTPASLLHTSLPAMLASWLNSLGMLLPQALCTCYSLCLEHTFPDDGRDTVTIVF